MFFSSVFDTFLVNPFINILVVVYQGLSYFNIPYSLGFSIIVLTVIIRFLMFPFTKSQIKASKKMHDIAPHISNLKTLHKKDAKRLQQETMKLYKEHGINPASGCLLLIIQMPVIYGLYSVLNKIVHLAPSEIVSEVNKVLYLPSTYLTRPWDPTFFGLSLGQSPSGLIATIGPIILLVPILTGAFQFVQSKMMLPPQKPGIKKDKKNEDFATAFQTQSTYLFPVMLGFFSFTFPIGLSLYWNAFTVFGIIQQYQVSGFGGLKIPKIKNGGKK